MEVIENLTDKVVNKTAESLAKKLENKVKSLIEDNKKISELHSNIDILLKRYYIDKSVFDKLAIWYGEKAYWKKALLLFTSVASAVFIGSLMGIAIAFSLMLSTITILLISAFMLHNHHNAYIARNSRLHEDTEKIEQRLKDEVEKLSLLENKLQDIFIKLNKALLNLLEENDNITKANQELLEQINTLEAQVSQLADEKSELISETSLLKSSVTSLEKQVSTYKITLQKRMKQLDELILSLDTSVMEVNKAGTSLAKNATSYERILQSLDNIPARQQSPQTTPPSHKSFNELISRVKAAVYGQEQITESTHSCCAVSK